MTKTHYIYEISWNRIVSILNFPLIRIIIAFLIMITPLCLRPVLLWNTISNNMEDSISQGDIAATKAIIDKQLSLLDKRWRSYTPRSYFMIINTASNEFELHKGNELIKKDKCSTGSYILLRDDKEQQWMFKTPKGEFRIQGKVTSPVWKKPDWAFVEQGLPVPSINHHSRFEYGVLGDYALSLGHGYLIHGTLYQRFLGLPVTHGCVRLNDENLELVYRSLPVGAKVYIY